MLLKSQWLLALILLIPVLGCSPEKYAGITLQEPIYSALPNPGILYDGKIDFAYGQGGSAGFQIYDFITGMTVNDSDPTETYHGMNSISITVPAAGTHNWAEPIFLNQATDYSSGHYTTGTLYVMATGQISGLQFTVNIFNSAATSALTLTNQWQKVTCVLPANLTAVTIPLELNIFGFNAYPFTVYASDIIVQ